MQTGSRTSLFKQFMDCEDGATSIEYALIAGIVGISLIASLQGIPAGLTAIFDAFGAFFASISVA